MRFQPRIRPALWPVVAAAAPALVPAFALLNRRFHRNEVRADASNRRRLADAAPLDLPELDFVELTVLVEQQAAAGFRTASGVSYLLRTDRGSLLFDVGFGEQDGALVENVARLKADLSTVDEVVISHLHLDHMGGLAAARGKAVAVPADLRIAPGRPCYLPDRATAGGLKEVIVAGPRVLKSGLATTGPLARSLFFLGYCEEQALIARVKHKGLVVVTGCGHQTVTKLLELVPRLSPEPLYALVGGLHFPITASRSNRMGISAQQFFGTGKPPWRRIGDEDLTAAVAAINAVGPRRALLSAHDSCDHALDRFARELRVQEFDVLRAGATYRL